MKHIEYTHAQLATLRNLARAYGHGWACEPDMPISHPVPGARMSQSMIRECYEAIGRRDGWQSWQYGIAAPEAPGYSGAVCHTTGTGRVSWQVHDDGSAGIVISRPAPGRSDDDRTGPGVVVLSARVVGLEVEIRTPDSRDHRIPDVHTERWSPDDGPRAGERHGDALQIALAALVGESAALAALDRAGVRVSRSYVHCFLCGMSYRSILSHIVGAPVDPPEGAAVEQIHRCVGCAQAVDRDGLVPEDRRVADRIATLPEVEPPPGWEDRAVADDMIQSDAVAHALRILHQRQHPEHVRAAGLLLAAGASTLDDLWRAHVAADYVPEVWTIAALAWHLGHARTDVQPDPRCGYLPDALGDCTRCGRMPRDHSDDGVCP